MLTIIDLDVDSENVGTSPPTAQLQQTTIYTQGKARGLMTFLDMEIPYLDHRQAQFMSEHVFVLYLQHSSCHHH